MKASQRKTKDEPGAIEPTVERLEQVSAKVDSRGSSEQH